MNYRVRPMAQGDLQRVAEIYRYHADRDPPDHWGESVASAMRAEPGPALAWVAEAEGGALIGYVIGDVRSWEFGSEPAGWITGIGVDAEHWGEGLGRALLEALIVALRAHGVTTLRTMVRRDDVPVLRFFRDTGFAAGPYTQMELSWGDEP